MRELSYAEAREALERALVFGINPSLDGITELCDALDRPQDSFRVVQVAGTNGKTSTCRFVHALLKAHGHRAGLYTSPELERVNERVELDDGPVGNEEFARAVSAATGAGEGLRPGRQGTMSGFTEFELMTAAALWLFQNEAIETAVLEVGMGGRWDATSVASPSVAVVTGIGLDHMAVLGETPEEIGAEKAAIIKAGSTAVLGPGTAGLEDIFIGRADTVGAEVRAVRGAATPSPVSEAHTVRYEVVSHDPDPAGHTVVDVAGACADYRGISYQAPVYQSANVATAIAAVEALLGGALDLDVVRSTFDHVRVPGRFELVRALPPVVVDGSHNPEATAVLAQAMSDAWPDRDELPCLLLGVFADKDVANIVRSLAGHACEIIATAPNSPRALPAEDLAALVERVTGTRPAQVTPLAEAVRVALSRCENGLVITGSLSTAGQARTLLLDASATAR